MISALDRTAWRNNKDGDFIPDGEHIWKFWVEYSSVFVACQGEHIIGALAAFRANEGALYVLHKIFVDEEFLNMGVGAHLFELLCHDLDDCNMACVLTVAPDNTPMINLCDKYSFTDREFILGYYRSNEDRFLLTRQKQSDR